MDLEEEKKKLKIQDERKYTVAKANDLIRKAKFELGLQEQKTLAFIFSKVKPDDKIFIKYSFSLLEFCEVLGIEKRSGKNYKDIEDVILNLQNKSFWFINAKGQMTSVSWIQKSWVDNGIAKIRLDEDIQEYIIGLKDKGDYTEYQLWFTLALQSKYSFRLYELMKSYQYQREHIFEIEELKENLNAQNYKDFKDFKKRVLNKALDEINTFTDIRVIWSPIYKGRKIIKLKFKILAWLDKDGQPKNKNALEAKLNKTIA